MKLLEQLWDLAEREGKRQGSNANYAFERIGLYMFTPPLKTEEYDATPLNSTTFATTGGDGDHFGLLHIDGEVRESSPVVMTMPMDFINIIVGSNLYKFLCLGYDYGYFALHDFSYRYRDNVLKLSNPDKWIPDCLEDCADYYLEAEKYLPILRQELNLKPLTNVEALLNELQQRYLPLIQLKKDN